MLMFTLLLALLGFLLACGALQRTNYLERNANQLLARVNALEARNLALRVQLEEKA